MLQDMHSCCYMLIILNHYNYLNHPYIDICLLSQYHHVTKLHYLMFSVRKQTIPCRLLGEGHHACMWQMLILIYDESGLCPFSLWVDEKMFDPSHILSVNHDIKYLVSNSYGKSLM
jgi:hypothetical protein